MTDELPPTREARVDWVIRAPDNAEMRRRYDIWAAAYDSDVGSLDDYLAPMRVAETAARLLAPGARILDAGAGTGLLGKALQDLGFAELVAVDYSDRMLDIARAKGIYGALHCCDLAQPTTLAAQSFDAVVTAGTTTQMPPASLREFARLLRSRGRVIFGVIPEAWESCGWAAVLSELQAEGALTLTGQGPPFQMMPTSEPEFICEVWEFQVP